MDYNRLRDEHDRLRNAYDRLSKDYADSLAGHKALKSELNSLQLKLTEQMGELAECKEQLTSAVNEVQKAENRLEVGIACENDGIQIVCESEMYTGIACENEMEVGIACEIDGIQIVYI